LTAREQNDDGDDIFETDTPLHPINYKALDITTEMASEARANYRPKYLIATKNGVY
jgi:hypothetical protein